MRLMNMVLGFSITAGALAMGMTGCGDETGSGTGNSSSSSSSTGGSSGFPCSPVDPVCKQVKSDCIALEDNAGDTGFALRMGQLSITKPDVLKTGSAVGNLVAGGVQMALPKCNLDGTGNFSWILQFDNTAGTMTTGGSKPVADPAAGYCMIDETLGTTPVKPVSVATKPANGVFAADVGDLVVPIYLDAMNYVLMPLKATKINGTLSSDNNCIGKYNADKLDPANNCIEEPPEILAFTNGGTIEGHILLEDADQIIVESLGQSLCVVLSGNPAMYGNGASPNLCKRDAMMKIEFKGDWCTGTNMAADATCTDSMKMTAEYAASGVKFTGKCQ